MTDKKKNTEGVANKDSDSTALSEDDILGLAPKKKEKKLFQNQYTKNLFTEKKNITPLILSFLGSITIGCLLVFFSGVRAQMPIPEKADIFLFSGTSGILQETNKEKKEIAGESRIFGTEYIHNTGEDAEVQLGKYGTIHLKKNAEIRIQKTSPLPTIEHISGDIVVSGIEGIQINYQNAFFPVRWSSGLFSRSGDTVEVFAFLNTLFGSVWSSQQEEGQKPIIALREGKKITFSMDNIPPTLADLQYSKFTKELRLSFAKKSKEEEKNISTDRKKLKEYSQNIYTEDTKNTPHISLLSFLETNLTFFSQKKNALQKREQDRKENIFYREYVFRQASKETSITDIPKETLNQAASLLVFLPFSEKTAQHSAQIAQSIARTSNETEGDMYIAQIFTILLAQASEEESVKHFSEVTENLQQYITKSTPEETRQTLVEVYQSLLVDIITSPKNTLQKESLAFLWVLDNIAKSLSSENKYILALENVERNREMIGYFLNAEEFALSKYLLDKNTEYLDQKYPPNLFRKQKNLIAKHDVSRIQYQVFQSKGALSTEEFHAVLTQKNEAEALLRKLQTKGEPKEDIQYVHMYIKQQLQQEGIHVLEFGEEDSTGNIHIQKGTLSSGEVIEAQYNRKNGMLSHLSIPAENILLFQEISPDAITFALEKARSETKKIQGNSISKDIITLTEGWNEESADDTPDPILIDISKKLLLTRLRTLGFGLQIEDIFFVKNNLFRVSHIHIPDVSEEEISAQYDASEELFFDISSSGNLDIPKSANRISGADLFAIFTDAIEIHAQRKEHLTALQRAFAEAGLTLDEKDTSFTNDSLLFRTISLNNEILSGTASPKEKKIILLRKNGNTFARDIPYATLREVLLP